MSSPSTKKPSTKKRVSGKKKEAKSKRVVKEKDSKPTGAPPFATVEVRHGEQTMWRRASGFSRGEVRQAGLSFGLARRWGLLVDDRRRSTLEGNVASLKKWSTGARKTTEERVEGEVRKVEKAVAREVRKVEKEAEKVEREIVKKVEAPIKKRARKKAAAKSETS